MKNLFCYLGKIKFISIVILFTVNSYFSIGQSIVSLEIIPNNPTSSDEIFLASHIVMSKMYNYPSTMVSKNGSDVVVDVCFFTGGFAPTHPTHYYDTISLGFFATGTYNLEFNLYSNFSETECDESDIIDNFDTTYYIDRSLSTKELDFLDTEFYPNPATNQLNFTLNDNSNSLKLEVFDISGKRMKFKEYINHSNDEFEGSLDISDLKSGLYFCKFTIGSKQVTNKFIKE
jgi:hypothetical protein